jgi:hypothetical protein
MKLVQQLLNKSNGLHYRQEYLCLAKEAFQNPLHVYLVETGKVVLDITNLHSFVGYCPLVFALPSSLFPVSGPKTLQLIFSHAPLQQNDFFREKDAIATLVLRKIDHSMDESIVHLYEGVNGKHRFLSSLHQSIIQLNNRLYGKKPGNVFLNGNLYEQVQIGYAVPRKICLITVGMDNLYNHFPTDLHGPISKEFYVISLRHQGNACKQVESSGRIALSDMDVNSYQKVYGLGKNHMQPLKERSEFDFSSRSSRIFNLPLPKGAIACKELGVINSFIMGIHRIILFRIVHAENINSERPTLAHIHNCYATWRNKQGIEGNYLMR